MLIKTLDGLTVKWTPKSTKTIAESALHLATRKYLKKKLPAVVVLEEVPIRVRRKKLLKLDFFIPSLRLAIECQGRQHSEFVPFFHGNYKNFLTGQKNDNDKEEWCRLNNIRLYLIFDESDLRTLRLKRT